LLQLQGTLVTTTKSHLQALPVAMVEVAVTAAAAARASVTQGLTEPLAILMEVPLMMKSLHPGFFQH